MDGMNMSRERKCPSERDLLLLLLLLLSRFSRVRLFAAPWTAAYQAPPSMGFSRQEYWSGVPLPSPGRDLVSVELRGQSRGISEKPVGILGVWLPRW